MGTILQDEFELRTNKPVDDRSVFQTLAAMNALDNTRRFEGLRTYCVEDSTKYIMDAALAWQEDTGGGVTELDAGWGIDITGTGVTGDPFVINKQNTSNTMSSGVVDFLFDVNTLAITANTTIASTNASQPSQTTLIVLGHASNDYTVNFGYWLKRSDLDLTVKAGKANVYTIIYSGAIYFVAGVTEMGL